jgi:hypothetical protein
MQNGIQKWAEGRGLWIDSGFKSYLQYYNDEPNEVTACVTVLLTEGGFLKCSMDI